jgi:hypothetical protein
MNTVLTIVSILILISLVSFAWAMYKAPYMEDYEDYLIRTKSNYLGQRIKE